MEKLIITCEVENLPEGSNILDFQIVVMENGWLTRFFKDWKRVTYRRAMITNLEVERA